MDAHCIFPFGFLSKHAVLTCTFGRIEPVSTFNDAKHWIGSHVHSDGFLYPPFVHLETDDGPKPNSSRSAHLHQLPASHQLILTNACHNAKQNQTNAMFAIQALAYIYGTHLQFEGWFFDTRVPIRSHHNIVLQHGSTEHFLSRAYKQWINWQERDQLRFSNILFMLNRAPAYEWDWEHFLIEFMIFDGLQKTWENTREAGAIHRRPKSRKLVELMFNELGVPLNQGLLQQFSDLRNDLFHETLWDRGHPCTSKSWEAVYAPILLRRLNQRIVLKLLDYKNEYASSIWWDMSPRSFDRAEP